jgi:predicted TPR repeat methyltransferase
MEDQDQADPSDQQDQDETVGAPGIELSDEQLIELIKNAHALSPEQQQQLQLILQQRMKAEMVNERAQSYQNIYQILMDNVKRAKDRLAPLGQVQMRSEDSEETDRRILRQKQEFETLYRQYQNELKAKELKKKDEDTKVEKRLQRESRI